MILRSPTSPPIPLAIRPYPTQYLWTGRDGLTIRPIRPEDEPLIIAFHDMLSDHSIYLRYFHAIKYSARVAHDRLTRICFNDYDREIALVAEVSAPDPKIIGVCRLTQKHGLPEAEFAMLIADPYQGQGFGTELLTHLIEVARAEGLQRLTGEILAENHGMQHLCKRVGFQLNPTAEPGILSATLDLTL